MFLSLSLRESVCISDAPSKLITSRLEMISCLDFNIPIQFKARKDFFCCINVNVKWDLTRSLFTSHSPAIERFRLLPVSFPIHHLIGTAKWCQFWFILYGKRMVNSNAPWPDTRVAQRMGIGPPIGRSPQWAQAGPIARIPNGVGAVQTRQHRRPTSV